MAFFSIIVASFNKAETIERTLLSLLGQSFTDFEIVVVDDGSVDDTALVVKRIFSARITYIYQKNQGVTAARNKGVTVSAGRYIVFLDADDWVAPDWLEQFHLLLSSDQYDIAFCDVEVRDQSKQTVKVTKARFPYRDTVEDRSGLFLTGAFCIRRDLFQRLGMYDEKIKFGENAEFSIRTIAHKPYFSFTDRVGLYYEVGIDGASKRWENRIKDTEYIIRKHPEYFIENPHVKRLYLQVIAYALEKNQNYRKAIYFYVRSWAMKPFCMRNLARLARVIFKWIKSSFII